MRSSGKSGVDELRAVLKASAAGFLAIGLFSFFVNLLVLTGPLFMLQIYDRVLSSRSEATLVALTGLIVALYLIMGVAFTMMLARFAATDRDDAPAPDRGRLGALIHGLGQASYPTYLFHGPFVMWLASLMTRTGWKSADWRVTWILLSVVHWSAFFVALSPAQ